MIIMDPTTNTLNTDADKSLEITPPSTRGEGFDDDFLSDEKSRKPKGKKIKKMRATYDR